MEGELVVRIIFTREYPCLHSLLLLAEVRINTTSKLYLYSLKI